MFWGWRAVRSVACPGYHQGKHHHWSFVREIRGFPSRIMERIPILLCTSFAVFTLSLFFPAGFATTTPEPTTVPATSGPASTVSPTCESIDPSTWWRHQIETFSALLALCAGNSPVTSEFPAQRPVTLSYDVFFDLRVNKRLSKQSWGWWSETPSPPLWLQCNAAIKQSMKISR